MHSRGLGIECYLCRDILPIRIPGNGDLRRAAGDPLRIGAFLFKTDSGILPVLLSYHDVLSANSRLHGQHIPARLNCQTYSALHGLPERVVGQAQHAMTVLGHDLNFVGSGDAPPCVGHSSAIQELPTVTEMVKSAFGQHVFPRAVCYRNRRGSCRRQG